MDETRGREALTAELRHAIEAAKQKAEDENNQPHLGYALRALEELDRKDPGLDVHCTVCNVIVQSDGSLEMLKIARQLGYPWNTNTSYFAACIRNVDVMAYLHENGCPWDAGAVKEAAARGHLEMLQYLFDHGCPWHTFACANAAYGGHLECLRYLHEHGCPWDGWTIQAARDAGHIDCLEYARAHGCPEDGEDDDDDDDDEDDQRELAKRISDKLPAVMAMIDEHSAALPEGAYVEMCGFLRQVHSLVRALER